MSEFPTEVIAGLSAFFVIIVFYLYYRRNERLWLAEALGTTPVRKYARTVWVFYALLLLALVGLVVTGIVVISIRAESAMEIAPPAAIFVIVVVYIYYQRKNQLRMEEASRAPLPPLRPVREPAPEPVPPPVPIRPTEPDGPPQYTESPRNGVETVVAFTPRGEHEMVTIPSPAALTTAPAPEEGPSLPPTY
ncbi:hypothetical protein BC828DRAFT_389214 [Blastocladiella britannica]|nr:hypothetical protein BC828DRAFT_389214 [Blastocladiella britannica]